MNAYQEETQMNRLEKGLDDLRVRFELLSTLLYERHARPYYALDTGWALTHLDTGHPFYVNTRERGISPWVIMAGYWEPEVDRVTAAMVKSGMRVADIGAHMGYHTVKLGALVGHLGWVHAFEANPEMHLYVEANMDVNAIKGCLHKYGLGAEPGEAMLSFPKNFPGQASLLGRASEGGGCKVEIRTLDSVLKGAPLDFIKMDVEGYELHVLRGAKATLAASPDCTLVVETTLSWDRFSDLASLTGNRPPYIITTAGVFATTLEELPQYLVTQALEQANILFCPESRAGLLESLKS